MYCGPYIGRDQRGEMRSMKILELCLSPDFGGLELYMRDFSRWLSNRKDVSLYLALRQDSKLDDALRDLDVPKLYAPGSLSPFPLKHARQLARFIATHQVDVVHVHWKDDLFVTALAKKLSNHPFAFFHTRQMMVPGRKYDPYHWFVYRTLDRFIAITRQIEQQARDNLNLPSEKIAQIYYGVRRSPRLKPEELKRVKEQFGIGQKFTIGLVGRIDWYKAQYLIIEAMAILKKNSVDMDCVIVGHAMDENYLAELKQKIIDSDLSDRIRFIDFTDKPHELMQCFDVLVLTTHVETFGLVLVEAMSLGIPVIGSNAGGVLEIIDHEKTGLLFKTKDAGSLANAIERMQNDPKFRQRLAKAGEAKAKKEYDTNNQHEKVLALMFESTGIIRSA